MNSLSSLGTAKPIATNVPLPKSEINIEILVKETHDMLHDLGESTQLELCWIKAHDNYTGNEIADQEAKLGTSKPIQTQVPLPKREIHKTIEESTHEIWQNRWERQIKSKTIETLMPKLDLNLARYMM